MSINAYKKTIRESESPKQIEARVFARVTGAMEQYRVEYIAATDRPARTAILANGLRDAVAQNRQLWVRLRDDLSSDTNGLPENLRASLLSISMWVDRTCDQVIGGGTGLPALIDVNRNIITGLLGQQPAPAEAGQHGTQSYAQAV